MKKLIYDSCSHGQKIIFSTAQELDSCLANLPENAGTLFAIAKHIVATVYTVEVPSEGENLWRLTTSNENFYITFKELVDKYDLYFIDNHQMIALIEACEN